MLQIIPHTTNIKNQASSASNRIHSLQWLFSAGPLGPMSQENPYHMEQ